MKNKVIVEIGGNEYTILASEPEEYIHKIAGTVNRKIAEMMEANPRMSQLMAAVLAGVTFCDEQFKAQSAADNLRNQLKVYLDDAAKQKSIAEEHKQEIALLNQKIQELRVELAKKGNVNGPDGR